MNASLETIQRFVTPSMAAALLLTLARRGLLRTYIALSVYLTIGLLASFVLFTMPIDSAVFLDVYSATEPVLWVLQYFIVVELMRKGFASYTGIRRLTTQVQVGAFVVVVAVIYATTRIETSNLFFVQSLHRAVEVGGLIGLSLLTLIIWLVPIRLPDNTYRYVIGFFIVFGGDALLISASGWAPNQQTELSFASSLLEAAVQLWWSLKLTNAGEKLPESQLPAQVLEEPGRALAGQLERLNEVLRRAQGM